MTREYATPDDVPLLDVMFDLLNDGSKHFPSLELSDWMEQHSASSGIRFGNFGCMFTFRCLKEDFPQMKKILGDALVNPTFSETELKNEQQAIMSNFYRSMSDAGSQHNEFINTTIFPGQREGLSRLDTAKMQLRVTPDTLRALYKRYVVADSMIVTLFGDLSESEARKAAQDFRHAMPKGTLPGAPVPSQIAIADTTYTEQYRFEETNIDLITAAPGIKDADFPVMTVIASLLNGSHGRLFNVTRGGTRDLAYYAYADYNSYYSDGYFQVTSQTSLPKADTLMAVLRAQLTDLCNTPVSPEELASAVSENHKILLNLFTDNLTPLTTTNYQAMGLGYDYLYHSDEILSKVTPADVQRVARKYFSHITGFVSKPQPQLQRYGE
jgi:zinc protease